VYQQAPLVLFAAELLPFRLDCQPQQAWKDAEEASGSLATVVAGFHWFALAGQLSTAEKI
jgi:hypothetical protein